MDLKLLLCPNCGGDKLVKTRDGYTCTHCGGHFVQDTLDAQETLLKALDAKEQEKLRHARSNLYNAAHAENVSSERVTAAAWEVKKYFPNDFMANFYEAACDSDKGAVNRFLDKADVSGQDKTLLVTVCEFMIASLEKRNVGSMKNFLERVHLAGIFIGWEYEAYLNRVEEEAKKLDDGVYAAHLTCEVFIAYSSKDMAEVHELVDYLEAEGKLRCFVAERNIRHGRGAAENYQRILETAMKTCQSVVFVSTGNSRDLDCEGLSKEIAYFLEHRKEIHRVEYRPSSDNGKTKSGAKPLLESFFAELQYARTKEDVLDRIIRHKFHLNPAPQPVPEQPANPTEPAETIKHVQPAKQTQPTKPVQSKSPKKLCEEGTRYYKAKDFEKAVELFEEAAKQGFADAQEALGVCYCNGQGVPQDYKKAVEWYTKAAEQGDADAQCNLGYCYDLGRGVPQDYEKAVEWYTKAAEQGNAEAQYNLGVCYRFGRGVPQDYKKAVEWYTKAAEQGYKKAQEALRSFKK